MQITKGYLRVKKIYYYSTNIFYMIHIIKSVSKVFFRVSVNIKKKCWNIFLGCGHFKIYYELKIFEQKKEKYCVKHLIVNGHFKVFEQFLVRNNSYFFIKYLKHLRKLSIQRSITKSMVM